MDSTSLSILENSYAIGMTCDFFFSFILFSKQTPTSKQCRPQSEATSDFDLCCLPNPVL